MTNDLAKIEHNGFTLEQVKVLSNLIAKDLTPDEMQVFLYTCSRTKLDPFAKQIYAIKRGGKMCIQTAVDGFRLIAERSGKYSPGRDTEFLYDKDGKLTGAKVFVKKMTPDGTWHEVSATAFLKEYSSNQGLWTKMPSVMIEKVAECRALRRCFPAEMGGVYGEDEMEQAEAKKEPEQPQQIECEVISMPPPKEAKKNLTQEQVDELMKIMNEEQFLQVTKFCVEKYKTEDLAFLNINQYNNAMAKAQENLKESA